MKEVLTNEAMIAGLVNQHDSKQLAIMYLAAIDEAEELTPKEKAQLLKFQVTYASIPYGQRGDWTRILMGGRVFIGDENDPEKAYTVASISNIAVRVKNDGRKVFFSICDDGYYVGAKSQYDNCAEELKKNNIPLPSISKTAAAKWGEGQRQMRGFLPDSVIKPAIMDVLNDKEELDRLLTKTDTEKMAIQDYIQAHKAPAERAAQRVSEKTPSSAVKNPTGLPTD